MTQEVQPLAWQKRTNLEEHQQFFSKINEIIANLAPTVNEAEQAIAQATQAIAQATQAITQANQAIASANAAVATANAASANADAAAQQAQTAANTVAGYNTRLTTAEGNITALQEADGNNIKITGDHAIGNYALLLTDNQISKGFKSGRFAVKESSTVIPQPETNGQYRLMYTIKNVSINTAVSGHIQVTSNLNYGYYGEFVALVGSEVWGGVSGISFGNYTDAALYFGYDGSDLDVWVKDQSYRPKQVRIDNVASYGNLLQPDIITDGATVVPDYIAHKTYTVTGSVSQ